MNQDEKYAEVIVGIASDAAKAMRIWEAFRKLFLTYTEEVIETLTPVAEALSTPLLFGFDEPCPSAEELESFFKEVDESSINLTGTSPKKYGLSLMERPRKTTMHYNYIPRTPKNLPYQRRAY